MTRDPFLRLALLTGCSVYALGVVLVGVYVGVWAAAAVVLAGAVLATAVTVENAPAEPKRVNGDAEHPHRPKGFLRLPGPGSDR